MLNKKNTKFVLTTCVALSSLLAVSDSKAEQLSTFNGTYVGGTFNLGWSRMKNDLSVGGVDANQDRNQDNGQATSLDAIIGTGSTFGTPVYFGLEGQLNLLNGKYAMSSDYSNVKYRRNFGVSGRVGLPFTCKLSKIDFMPYLLAGFDYGRLNSSVAGTEEYTTSHAGLVSPKIGIGVDAAITKNVFARFEYNQTYINAKATQTNDALDYTNKFRGGISTVKFGMYYKF